MHIHRASSRNFVDFTVIPNFILQAKDTFFKKVYQRQVEDSVIYESL